jgi:hypothetical protein
VLSLSASSSQENRDGSIDELVNVSIAARNRENASRRRASHELADLSAFSAWSGLCASRLPA